MVEATLSGFVRDAGRRGQTSAGTGAVPLLLGELPAVLALAWEPAWLGIEELCVIYRAHKKLPPPQDYRRALGIGLL